MCNYIIMSSASDAVASATVAVASASEPCLVVCSSNGTKTKMYRRWLPRILLNTAVFITFPVIEIQGSSEEVIRAKVMAYLERERHKFHPDSVFLIDDMIVEFHPHDSKKPGFPGAGTTTMFPWFKERLHEFPTVDGKVYYTCSIGIAGKGIMEYHEGTVSGTFVPKTNDDGRNIDPQFLAEFETVVLALMTGELEEHSHPRCVAIRNANRDSELLRRLMDTLALL